jgi:hypothetical protein
MIVNPVCADRLVRHACPGDRSAGREEPMFSHYRVNQWISTMVVLVSLVVAAADGFGAENPSVKQVNVLGTSVIHQKNLADGKQNAVDDALAAAVGRVVMEMLTGETVVRRFQLINDNILNQHDNYIQNYRVLTESISGTTIRALVQVDVVTDRLSRDLSRLGLALSGAVYPRILFMIAEKKVTDGDTIYWWGAKTLKGRTICEGAMVATLQAAGFEIVDPPALKEALGLDVNLAQADMLALGARLGADVLVSGTGVATNATNTMGGPIQAEVVAQAFNVKTGQLLGRTRQKAINSDQDVSVREREALAGAGALAGDDLARQVMAAWQQTQDSSTVIDVAVEGTSGQIASFVKLRTAISSLSGVKELKMKEMAADKALMAVRYQGSARSMADALLLKTFSGFGIDIYDVTPAAIRIRLVNK